MFTRGKPRTPLVPLRQTKLCVSQKDNKLKYDGFVEERSQMRPKKEFVYVPTPCEVPLKKFCYGITAKQEKRETSTELPPSPMSKPGRDMISLIGRVDFCLKMYKLYPQLNAIWNVYGKLLRIINGKRGEQTFLVRNEGSGPILQGIYYDFEGESKTWNAGSCVHLVGRFIGGNRLQTFKVAQVSDIDWQQQFMRIENVTTYILMQNNVHK